MKKCPIGTLILLEYAIFVVIGHNIAYLGYNDRGIPYGEQIIYHLWRLDFGEAGWWSDYYMKDAKILFEPKSK